MATHSSRSCRDGGEPGLDIKCLIFYERLNHGNCQYIERQRYLIITINNIFAGFLFHVSIARMGGRGQRKIKLSHLEMSRFGRM